MNNFSKSQIISRIYQATQYHGRLLDAIEELFKEEKYLIASIQLLLVFENVCRYKVDDYDFKSVDVYKKMFKLKAFSGLEHEIVNGENSIRCIRNFLMHKNQSRFNFIIEEDGVEILYPFTEQLTWRWFYEKISPILFAIIYNILCENTLNFTKIDTSSIIKRVNIRFKKITPEDVLRLKGFNEADIETTFKNITSESEKFRVAENASDINMLECIFKTMFR